MQLYEYKVVPAPRQGERAKGARSGPERFAAALMSVMNALGRDGWDYLRADTLPCDERVGLTGKSSSFLHMLVFRRPLRQETGQEAIARPAPQPLPVTALHPEGSAPRVMPFVRPVPVPAPPAPPRETAPGND